MENQSSKWLVLCASSIYGYSFAHVGCIDVLIYFLDHVLFWQCLLKFNHSVPNFLAYEKNIEYSRVLSKNRKKKKERKKEEYSRDKLAGIHVGT